MRFAAKRLFFVLPACIHKYVGEWYAGESGNMITPPWYSFYTCSGFKPVVGIKEVTFGGKN